jgi:hypothetical protein
MEKGNGFAGERSVVVPASARHAAVRQQQMLQGLVACGAGCFPRAAGHYRRRPQGAAETIAVYCVRGGGWGEVAGRLHPIRTGDLLILPPRVPHAYGAHASDPWTIHWFHASGSNVGMFIEKLGVSPHEPVIWLGEDLHVVSLFNELQRRSLGPQSDPEETDRLRRDQPLLAELYRASVCGRIATGPRVGRRVTAVGDRIDVENLEALAGPRCATVSGVSVHANVCVPAHDRMRLERLCRLCGAPHKRH